MNALIITEHVTQGVYMKKLADNSEVLILFIVLILQFVCMPCFEYFQPAVDR